MTAFLAPIFSTPWSDHFHRSPYTHQKDSLCSAPLTTTHAPSTPTIVFEQQQQSHASALSVVPAPACVNDENTAPIAIKSLDTKVTTSKGVAPVIRRSRFVKDIEDLVSDILDDNEDEPTQSLDYAVGLVAGEESVVQSEDKHDPMRHALAELRFHKRGRRAKHLRTTETADSSESSVQPFPEFPDGSQEADEFAQTPLLNTMNLVKSAHLAHLHSARRGQSSSIDTNHLQQAAGTFKYGHRKRLSDDSSAFVHTLKTASFSNASFKYLSRLNLNQSSENSGPLTGHGRFSLESERPATAHSVDDAALSRGLKRRQILVELSTTEESYVADLKALLYLYSTLLASGHAGNRRRSSIQQNVMELLSLHEGLLDQLHHLAYGAAARKWADTTSPRHLHLFKHLRRRSLDSNGPHLPNTQKRRTRSSISSVDRHQHQAGLVAEPADVCEVAKAFRAFMLNFSIYEDYCANHEIVAQELQRHLPTLWSAYESGIESLARSVVAIDNREHNSHRGVTVGDLLIKPIQRVCKYPLLFEDLWKHTPVTDCPTAHNEIETTLQDLRDIVHSVNVATHDHQSRIDIQRRWGLRERLNLEDGVFQSEHFRLLGNVILCGVLHLTYQKRVGVDGTYALCLLFGHHFIVALPNGAGKFDVVCLIRLVDMDIVSTSDGKGLQCDSALYTWKICFGAGRYYHEMILSACSKIEESQWVAGLQGKFCPENARSGQSCLMASYTTLDLKSIGIVFTLHGDLAGRPSVQRAATVGNRGSACQVILRNTHNAQDLQEFRQNSPRALGRSQSHATTARVNVLSPKRSERVRLESALSNVWTKDKLPYPGMIASRGERIIRASAGSLVRKLSLASIRSAHGPFSRRSASLSVCTTKSYEAYTENKRYKPVFQIRKESFDESRTPRKPVHGLPELDTMDSVIERMIAPGPPTAGTDHVVQRNQADNLNQASERRMSIGQIEPDDPANMFYHEPREKSKPKAEGGLNRRKRWSNPIELLKNWSADGFRNMVYSSR